MKEKRKKYIILSIIIIAMLTGVVHYIDCNRWFGNKLERTIAKIHTIGKLKGKFEKYDGYNNHLERPIYQAGKYPEDWLSVFTYEERVYVESCEYVDEKYVECMLDEDYVVELSRWEDMHLQIYKIKNIAKDVAIIVKSKKEDMAYVYCNESYRADNLKEYLQDHGIDENSELQRIVIEKVIRAQKGIHSCWCIQYNGTAVTKEVLEEMLINGEQKKCTDRNESDWSTGLRINLIDETGVGEVELTILCDGNIHVEGIFSQTFEFENCIEWGTELIKKLNEKEQGEIYESYVNGNMKK